MNRMACSIVSALGIVAVVVGCSDASGRPNAGPSSSSSGSKPNKMKAPAVSNPIDVARYRLDPCDLTAKVIPGLADFNKSKVDVAPAKGRTTKECVWKSNSGSDRSDTLAIQLQGSGLKTPYGNQRILHQYDEFKPTEIAGYPAVHVNTTDQQKSGVHVLILGVNNHESVHIDVDTDPENPSQAMAIAGKAAVAVVQKIQSREK